MSKSHSIPEPETARLIATIQDAERLAADGDASLGEELLRAGHRSALTEFADEPTSAWKRALVRRWASAVKSYQDTRRA